MLMLISTYSFAAKVGLGSAHVRGQAVAHVRGADIPTLDESVTLAERHAV
jgi:hypothetical protein